MTVKMQGGTAPDPEMGALFQQIRAEAFGRSGVPTSPTSEPERLDARTPDRPLTGGEATVTLLEAHPNNLPLPVTSFIGREREMWEIRHLLATTRLLTLTGPAGSGKTRLALEVAEEVLKGFAGGVWLVDLAALSDASLVPQTVAATLGVREEPGHTLTETVVESLRTRHLLLVLDNCEHVIGACAHLAEALLRTCSQVRLLATSREALGIAGEIAWPVPSLTLPDAGVQAFSRSGAQGNTPSALQSRTPSPPERLNARASERPMQSEAVRLFIERAVAARPGFALAGGEGRAVAEVCRKLDGIPLAIELAAARVNVLTVEEIASRLEDRFRLLTGGSRTALPRQQTLQAAMDWSYDLLSEAERTVLRRLSVFAGRWTLEAAEAVCAGDGIAGRDVLNLVSRLVAKSLVVARPHEAEARYQLLETVRQYGRDRLEEAGEDTVLRTRHRDFFVRLAEEGAAHMTGPEQARWLTRFEGEHDDFRTALRGSVAAGETETALRLGAALWRFWHVHGHLREGRDWLAAALALPEASAYPREQARTLNGAGALAHDQGDFDRAVALHQRALAIARRGGDEETMATAFNDLGNVLLDQGSEEEGSRAYHEALALWRELNDERGIAMVLHNLGSVAHDRGNYHEAATYLDESLALKRRRGDQRGIASSLNNLGMVAMSQGSHERAAALLNESLCLFQQLGDRFGIAMALQNLADLVSEQGNGRRAAALYRECLRHSSSLENRTAIAQSLEGLARMLAQMEQSLSAAHLYGAAEALREEIGAPIPVAERPSYERTINAARARVADAAWLAAWAEGRSMKLEQAIIYALEDSSRGEAD